MLDVPCSGLGTLARHPDARWRVSLDQIEILIQLQRNILEATFPLLSSGGLLVYSTCTIHPKENTQQISDFISRHPSIQLISEKQIWPGLDNFGDGFYAAVLQIN